MTDRVQPFQTEQSNLRGRLVRLGPLLDEVLGRHAYPEPVARLLGETLALAVALSSTLKYEGVCYAVRVTSPSNDHPLYRFFNKKNGTHFYTASEAEKASIIAHLSGTYRLDGPAYNVCVTPVAGATPVYRFFNKKNSTHFYTASAAEKANTMAKFASTYTLDGVAFYLAP